MKKQNSILTNLDNTVCFNETSGTINYWEHKGSQIFAPVHTSPTGSLRGGAHHCYPFFGPGRAHFSHYQKKHGFMRDGMSVIEAGVHREFFGFGKYKFQDVGMSDREYDLELMYWLRHNTLQCYVGGFFTQPLVQYGFHPYFKLDPQNPIWSVENKSRELVVSSNQLNQKPQILQKYMFDGSDIIITTNISKIQVSLGQEFGEKSMLVVWSDRPLQYICVEWVQFDWPHDPQVQYPDFKQKGHKRNLAQKDSSMKIFWSMKIL